jgi:iron-sulfur cluster assembly protein
LITVVSEKHTSLYPVGSGRHTPAREWSFETNPQRGLRSPVRDRGIGGSRNVTRTPTREGIVLTLTNTGAEAVRQIASGSGLEPQPGLRISPGEPVAEGTPLQISLAGAPEPNDQTIDKDGARVYVDAPVAEALGDKVLDAQIEGDQIRFSLRDAPDTG